jgi:ketosteroid isomerase-like protein
MTEGNWTASRLDSLFAAIDAKDTDAFLGFLTKDAVFRFGSAPELRGHSAIGDGVNGFFASIAGSRHAIKNVINSGSTLVCEAEVTYQRHNGSEITLPFTNVFELSGELVSHYKIYIDIAPLYAE